MGNINVNVFKKRLFINTIMLYILQFSTYIFSFLTVPYQTRILGPTYYGKLGFATSIMLYFQLFIDFGFLLSATEEVSHNRDNKKALSNIFSAVTISKLVLSSISLVILLIVCSVIPFLRQDLYLYLLFLFATILNSLLPDYLYRGLEQMSAITIRTVIIKGFFTIMVFVFLKKPSDYYVVPVLNIIGNFIALVGVYYHIKIKLNIEFSKTTYNYVKDTLKKSSVFFYSRIASTVYTASNTVILGFLYPNGNAVGYYTSADKLTSTAKSGLSPISDSLYPYMIKQKDYKLIKKVLLITMPIIIGVCAVIFVYAEPFCVLLFGRDFAGTAPVLKCMLPAVVFVLPDYLLGFPTLSAIGLTKYANISVIFGSVIHLFNLVILYFTGHLNMVTLGALTSVAEFMILSFRIAVIYKNRKLFKRD